MQTVKTKNGTFTIDEIRDRWVYKNLIRKNGYQFEDIDAVLEYVSGNVIDVGAHVGLFSVPLSKKAKKVWSIEGNPKTFETLQKNLNFNKCLNVVALNTIASDNFNTYELIEMPNDAETQYKKGNGLNGTPIDSLTTEKINFIKIDAEGMEPSVLKGAKKIIEIDKPYIYIEINKQALFERGNSVADIIPLLSNYTFYKFEDGFHRVFSLRQGALSNILAVPKGMPTPRATNPIFYLSIQIFRKLQHYLSLRK